MLLNAILPIFLLIIFGYGLKHFRIVNDDFWEHAEKLTYYIFFPSLLISKMATADLAVIDVWPMMTSSIISLVLITVIIFTCKALMKINNYSFGSVYQGSIRFNTYIGLALVDGLFGAQGLVIAAISPSILIPAVNIGAVTVFQYCRPGNKNNASRLSNLINQILDILKALLKNPLIIGCIVGIGINFIQLPIPESLLQTMRIIGSIALPLGLMTIGAAFIITSIKSSMGLIAISSVLKLIIYPFIAYFVATFLELDLLSKQILTIFCALPTASASYILAKKLNGDHQLMARIITLETVFSGMTLLFLLKMLKIG